MLGKKDKNIKIDNEMTNKVDKDLIVHNMPNISTKSFVKVGAMSSVSGARSLADSDKKNKHQTTGIIIVSLGIIFVLVLIYLSYRFIIKPAAQDPVVLAPVVSTPNSEVTPENTVPPLVSNPTASTTTVVEIEPSVVDLNTSSSTEELVSSTTPIATEDIPPILEILPVLDTDFDGLNDDEELALGTDSLLPDSDGDNYGDLSELESGYNPSGTDKLYSSVYLTKYQNSVGKYFIYYPASWILKSLNNDYATIISAPDNSLMQISVQGNPNIQNISSWYKATFPEESVSANRFKKGIGWEGVMGADGLNFYLTDKNRENIYIVSYIPALTERLAYPNIFQMIINSFSIN